MIYCKGVRCVVHLWFLRSDKTSLIFTECKHFSKFLFNFLNVVKSGIMRFLPFLMFIPKFHLLNQQTKHSQVKWEWEGVSAMVQAPHILGSFAISRFSVQLYSGGVQEIVGSSCEIVSFRQ